MNMRLRIEARWGNGQSLDEAPVHWPISLASSPLLILEDAAYDLLRLVGEAQYGYILRAIEACLLAGATCGEFSDTPDLKARHISWRITHE